jgi:hypothetical protein
MYPFIISVHVLESTMLSVVVSNRQTISPTDESPVLIRVLRCKVGIGVALAGHLVVSLSSMRVIVFPPSVVVDSPAATNEMETRKKVETSASGDVLFLDRRNMAILLARLSGSSQGNTSEEQKEMGEAIGKCFERDLLCKTGHVYFIFLCTRSQKKKKKKKNVGTLQLNIGQSGSFDWLTFRGGWWMLQRVDRAIGVFSHVV